VAQVARSAPAGTDSSVTDDANWRARGSIFTVRTTIEVADLVSTTTGRIPVWLSLSARVSAVVGQCLYRDPAHQSGVGLPHKRYPTRSTRMSAGRTPSAGRLKGYVTRQSVPQL